MKFTTTFPFALNDKVVSASRLVNYKECSLKGYLKYDLGYVEEEKYYLNRGTLFHEVGAIVLAGKYKRKSKYHEFLEQRFQEMQKDNNLLSGGKITEKDLLQLLHKAVDVFIDSVTNVRNKFTILDYKDSARTSSSIELEFRVPIVDLDTDESLVDRDIYGLIDEISYDEKLGLCVRDHKLHSERPYGFVLRSDLQLKCYAYVFYYLYKKGCFPQVTSFNSLTLGLNSFLLNKTKAEVNYKFLSFEMTENEIKAVPFLIQKYIRVIDAKNPVPNVTSGCLYRCSFQNLCARFQLGETIESAKGIKISDIINELDGEVI